MVALQQSSRYRLVVDCRISINPPHCCPVTIIIDMVSSSLLSIVIQSQLSRPHYICINVAGYRLSLSQTRCQLVAPIIKHRFLCSFEYANDY